MCILFLAVQQHPEYPLVIAANRDEFFDRETRVSSFWADQENMLAGRDMRAGGTWMGVTRNGRIAALTNIRDPQRIDPDAQSRGKLVTDFLISDVDDSEYTTQLKETKTAFNGYNLLFGEWHSLRVYNNHLDRVDTLEKGFHGLSNAFINSPWPKINRGVNNLQQCIKDSQTLSTETLFALLQDTTQAAPELLPDTGVPMEWEQRLSSIFIPGQDYGTRCSTLLFINKDKQVEWHERTYNNQGETTDQQSFQFTL